MRFSLLALAFALAVAANPATARGPLAPGLTLDEALQRAELAHPLVQARQARLTAIEGQRREADALLGSNPELEAQRVRRRLPAPDGRAHEWALGIVQPFETGGQRRHRRAAASAGLDAAQAEIDAARLLARAQAAQRFHEVLAAQRRVQLEEQALGLFEATARAVEKRRAAGEDTRLDANVALIEAERARNALAAAREDLLDARTALGAVLQLEEGELPAVVGELALPTAGSPYSLAELLATAHEQPRQRALQAQEQAARAAVSLEQARRYPDVSVGLGLGREGPGDARERLAMLSVSVPLPIFQRNDAALGQALSQATETEIERRVTLRDTDAQVHSLWARLESQRERVQRLQAAMMPVTRRNRQLAAKSRQAGQIGLLEQLLVNRQALDAARELDDALARYHATRIELEEAAGWQPEGSTR